MEVRLLAIDCEDKDANALNKVEPMYKPILTSGASLWLHEAYVSLGIHKDEIALRRRYIVDHRE
jgi:hypothetical protein